MRKPILERLSRKTIKKDGCWLWTGATYNGYGLVSFRSKTERVHRISAHVILGYDLDSKLQINHRCANRNCWNPEHLYLGTQGDNLRDASRLEHLGNGNKSKTHCSQGHDYAIYGQWYKRKNRNAERQCKICRFVRSNWRKYHNLPKEIWEATYIKDHDDLA